MERTSFDTYRPNLFPRLQAIGSRVRDIWELGRVTDPIVSNHIRREEDKAVATIIEAFPGTEVVTPEPEDAV